MSFVEHNNQRECGLSRELPASRESCVKALRSLLSAPPSGSPQSIVAIDEPSAFLNEKLGVSKKTRGPFLALPPPVRWEKKSIKKATNAKTQDTSSFYAGSAFQNSPDPKYIPIPSFDDDEH